MPHKPIEKLGVVIPEWVNSLDDNCLFETLSEATVARWKAIRVGALDRRETKDIIAAGDATLEQIEFKRYVGQTACRKAATVLRKYTLALDRAETALHGRRASCP